jgi:hypothetical protein
VLLFGKETCRPVSFHVGWDAKTLAPGLPLPTMAMPMGILFNRVYFQGRVDVTVKLEGRWEVP